jgi:GDP-D-mannose dehydratase
VKKSNQNLPVTATSPAIPERVGVAMAEIAENIQERYLRPAEVDSVIGDASKANSVLGWKPQVQTPKLLKIMVEADIQALEHARPTWIDRPTLLDWYPAPS